jgi:hypothetical protein
MNENNILKSKNSSYPPKDRGHVFSSNCVRLSGYELVFVGIIALAFFYFGPSLWQKMEEFEPAFGFRVPYQLSSDYWLYSRYSKWAAFNYDTLIIGDSVIWGHYVPPDSTLSHCLNQITRQERFANLGVDGIHPVALWGLLKYYGHNISGKKIVLHYNPLWMTSEKQDLQTTKEFHFNHPKLVPQFVPEIPCYRAPYSERISIIAERRVPVLSWTSHLKINYFDNMNIPAWTLTHPYKNPAGAVTLQIPAPADSGRGKHISWVEKGARKNDFPWVEIETSLQWKFFRRSVKLLRERGNSVFVLVGPFNEHMLKADSVAAYRKIISGIEIWLKENDTAFYIAPALPSRLYADASHPLKDGYALLAERLSENELFNTYILDSDSDMASSQTETNISLDF